MLIILGAIAVLIASVIIIGTLHAREIKNEIEGLFKQNKKTRTTAEVVNEADIEGLPEPIRRYLKHTQVIGKEKIKTVSLKQGGYFRMKEDQKWMPIKAEQYFNVDSAEFI